MTPRIRPIGEAGNVGDQWAGAKPIVYDDEGLISISHHDERIQLHTDAEVRAATLAIGNRAKRRREAAKLRKR